ncbi:MAG: PAS domain-containing protein [Planctomycetota bacterium]|nr:PAS domain-containing protein [Planctomycetota bacterium]
MKRSNPPGSPMAVASPGTGPPSTDASDLHTTLEEAEQLIRAIRGCEVDAFVVDSPHGKRVYTLSSADEPYRLLIERMGEGALTLSPAGVILYCNGRFARMLGSPLQTVIGADLRPRLAANDAEIPGGTDALLARLLAGSPGTDLKLECALVRADGSQLPVQIAASGLELNAVRSVCMVVTDLTTRHLYEQSRRDEQLRGHLDERSRTQGQLDLQSVILGQVSDAVVAVDAQQRISYLNHAAEQHYGVSSQGALGRRLDEICTRRWLAPADEALADAAFLNRGDWHGELVHVTRDGREIAVESVKATLWGKGGNPIGMLLTFRDITARKVTEEALRESEVRYRRLFETAKDGIVILDTDTAAIIDANPFIGELLGYSHAELMGKQLWQIGLFKDIEASKDAMRELQERRYIRYEDLPLETKAGRRINVEFVSNVYITGRRSVIQCNIRDISWSSVWRSAPPRPVGARSNCRPSPSR